MNCFKLGTSNALVGVLASIGKPICMDPTKSHILINLSYRALPDKA
jgi:hypothetical protein